MRNQQLLDEYSRRLTGIVSPGFQDRTILTVGVGAGSYAVEKLARLCPRRLKNCDFDRVELPNLARTSYAFADAAAERLKVDALALRLKAINPLVEVVSYSRGITDMNDEEIDEMFDGVDLVIAGTDQFRAQALINELAVTRGVPAVFIGIHAGAEGGRVVWYVPGETPCYRCVARDRFEAVASGNGGPVDLAAARGSLLDCQFIDMLAAKVAVAILERDQLSRMGRFYTKMAGRNDIVIRCDPDYGWGRAMWEAMLGDLPKQPKDFARELQEHAFFGMDSLWLRGEFDPDCAICGGSRRVRPQQSRIAEKRMNQV